MTLEEKAKVAADSRAWVEKMVIGLNLCPFAGPAMKEERIRFFVSESQDTESLYQDFLRELELLCTSPEEKVETSLLVIPDMLGDFEHYLDFLDIAEEALGAAGLEGVVQLASFHPDYIFAEAPEDDPANFSNRSPFPMLHFLREESVSKAVQSYPNIEEIPQRNIDLLREMGLEKLKGLHSL